jgi:glutamine synthetase
VRVQAEYIWIDGTVPTRKLRSKTKILQLPEPGTQSRDAYDKALASGLSELHVVPTYQLEDFPEWGFDGSSTYQADGGDSDCVLRPVAVVKDPVRKGEKFVYHCGGVSMTTETPNYLVLCEVFMPDGVTPHPTNKRAELRRVLEAGAADEEPWFGIEQEYTLFKGSRPLGFPESGYPAPQGPYYCGVGADEVVGRDLIEAHTQACLDAGILIEGTNAEVMPGQWEFQVGTGDPLTVADHLWLARWLLYRLGEDFGYNASLDPKPARGDWNGAGAHTNFSTRDMRMRYADGAAPIYRGSQPVKMGMDAIYAACEKLGQKTAEHIAVYGAGIESRLTGKHETCSYKEFRYGVADRGASIRIPRHVANKGFGYLEDRRPCANACPYEVTARILKTVCGVE